MRLLQVAARGRSVVVVTGPPCTVWELPDVLGGAATRTVVSDYGSSSLVKACPRISRWGDLGWLLLQWQLKCLSAACFVTYRALLRDMLQLAS